MQSPRPARSHWPKDKRSLQRWLHQPGTLEQFFHGHFQHFVPGARALVRLTVHFPGAFSPTSVLTKATLVVQNARGRQTTLHLRGNRTDQRTIRTLQVIARTGKIDAPKPLWVAPTRSYYFYRELPGRRYRDLRFSDRSATAVTGAIGRLLAKLHRLPTDRVPALRWFEEQRLLDQFQRLLRAAKFPNGNLLLDRLASLRRWERRWWSRLPQVIVQNDFQGSNILVDSAQRIHLLDFSRSGRGPLPIDAGQFVAHLTIMLAHRPAGQRARLRHRFLTAYRQGLPPAKRRVLTDALSGFELRAALEIIAISSLFLPLSRRDRILAPLINHLPSL